MFVKRILVMVLSGSLLLATAPAGFADQANQLTDQSPTPVVKQTPEQLQQLVAPIALYPDELVAEVVAAATYPTRGCGSGPLVAGPQESSGKAIGGRGR
jgi:hypothetical protein